jgi:hypothetical protein
MLITGVITRLQFSPTSQADSRQKYCRGQNYSYLAAEALRKVGFADAGEILPPRGINMTDCVAKG